MAAADNIMVKIEVKASDLVDACIKALTEDGTLVEVVRCKDCKHLIEKDGQCPLLATGDPYYDTEPKSDFFCADGERRE